MGHRSLAFENKLGRMQKKLDFYINSWAFEENKVVV